MTVRFRNRKILILTPVAIAVVYSLLYVIPLPFIPNLWVATAEERGDPFKLRHRMADGLLLTDRLHGRPISDVIALLGKPPTTGYFTEWDLAYPLGEERGILAIDSEWLVIRLDAVGRVSHMRLVRD